MALCATGLSQTAQKAHPVQPVRLTSANIKNLGYVNIKSIQPIMIVGNREVPLGPPIPYTNSNVHSRQNGALLVDSAELTGSPLNTTDTEYGEDWSTWNFGSGTLGETGRWYLPGCFAYTASPYTGGNPSFKSAYGIDIPALCYSSNAAGYTNTSLQYIDVFTCNDTYTAGGVPSSNNAGLKITLATAIAPGNVGIVSVNLTAGFAMPTGNYGWYAMAFLNNTFTGTINASSECKNAQSLQWGTKPGDATYAEADFALDGDSSMTDGSQVGSFGYYDGYEEENYATVASYTITRGTETSAHANANLSHTAGSDVVVKQKVQGAISNNNAEITAVLNLPSYSASDVMLRAEVIATSNAIPLNGTTSRMQMLMYNYVTANYDLVKTITPIINASSNGGSDGTWILADTAGAYGKVAPQNGNPISDYVNTSGATPQATVRFGVRNDHPGSPVWNLTCNYITVQYGTWGSVSPLTMSIALSTPH